MASAESTRRLPCFWAPTLCLLGALHWIRMSGNYFGTGPRISAFCLSFDYPKNALLKNLLLDSMRTLGHSCLFFSASASALWKVGESPSLRSFTGRSEVENRWTCHAGAGKEPAKRMAGLSWNGEIASPCLGGAGVNHRAQFCLFGDPSHF